MLSTSETMPGPFADGTYAPQMSCCSIPSCQMLGLTRAERPTLPQSASCLRVWVCREILRRPPPPANMPWRTGPPWSTPVVLASIQPVCMTLAALWSPLQGPAWEASLRAPLLPSSFCFLICFASPRLPKKLPYTPIRLFRCGNSTGVLHLSSCSLVRVHPGEKPFTWTWNTRFGVRPSKQKVLLFLFAAVYPINFIGGPVDLGRDSRVRIA